MSPSDLDPQGLWRSQNKEYDPMTLADIHTKARAFDSRVQRRNAIEYIACGVVIVGFAPMLLHGPNWMMQAGAALIMLGTVFVAWQLHGRGSVDASVEPGETLVDAYRRQLIRQRDAIRSVGSWYLAPFAPGMTLLLIGMWFRAPKPGVPIERAHMGVMIASAINIALFVCIWLLNLRGAKLLQKRIDDL
jgi:hypothetical protein